MRIDCHVHGDPANLQGDPQAYVDSCRERGIEAVVLIEPLARCLQAVERFGDFVIPVARIPMDSSSATTVSECINAGCLGIKFIDPAAPYGDERYWPMYDKLEELGRPAIFHTGYYMFVGRQAQPTHMEYMRAAQIDVIARRFPGLKILMSHFSNPWWEEAWKVSWSNRNVYADLSGGTAIHRSMTMWAEMFAPDGELLQDSIGKLCFGSDVEYFREGEFACAPYIAFHERLFDRIQLPEPFREAVNRGNIRTLFGLDGH